jgi:preprotein translocase subunit SecF
MEEQQNQETHKKNWHDKHYKNLMLIPLALLVFSFVYMGIFYSQHHDFFLKDISLKGGTSATIYETIDINSLKEALVQEFGEVNVREVSDLVTGEQIAVVVQTTAQAEETKLFLENYLGYELTEDNSSFEFTGSSLSESFYKQLLIAILVSFVFMAIVVFILFRNLVPSGAVIISAFADILMTLVIVNVLGIKMSSAGIIALLMLIGYSVDTDILLTNRVLKRQEGSLNEKLWGAFKTGMTMTLTSLFAVAVALLVVKSFSVTLTQIFTILVIGLMFDMLNTWITNASILKWYVNKREQRGQE